MIRCVILNGSGSTKPTTHGESRGTRAWQEDRRFFPVRNIRGSPPRAKREATMAGSRPPGEKRRDEDTLNASRRSDVSKYYDPFWEPPPDERQAAWNKIAEAVEAYSVSTDASTLASLLREEAIVHFYMAEALERITDDPHQKSKAIGIKRSEAAQVESFPRARSFPRPTMKRSANWWNRVAGNRCGRRSIPTHRWPRT